MFNNIFKILTVALFVGLFATPTFAQTACGVRVDVTRQLETAHQEVQQAVGLSSDGRVIEVFASASGSWTVLMTLPNGVTCVVATGEAWETVPAKVIGPTA